MDFNYAVLIPHGRNGMDATLTSILNQTILPHSIIIIDNKEDCSPVEKYFHNIARYKRVNISYKATNAKSISRVRYELAKSVPENVDYVLWADDDIILDANYVEKLAPTLLQKEVGGVQGIRIEVNGRENSLLDINAMNNVNAKQQELSYGDTFGFFCKVEALKEIDWDKILNVLDAKGVTGEDVLMGNYICQAGYKIIGVNDAFGYHLGAKNFSYWDNFLASDRIRELNFKFD